MAKTHSHNCTGWLGLAVFLINYNNNIKIMGNLTAGYHDKRCQDTCSFTQLLTGNLKRATWSIWQTFCHFCSSWSYKVFSGVAVLISCTSLNLFISIYVRIHFVSSGITGPTCILAAETLHRVKPLPYLVILYMLSGVCVNNNACGIFQFVCGRRKVICISCPALSLYENCLEGVKARMRHNYPWLMQL